MVKNTAKKIFLGVDIGSTTIKAVLLTEEGKVMHSMYQRTVPKKDAKLACTGRCSNCGQCNVGALSKTIVDFLASVGKTQDDISCTVVTGSQVVDELHRFLKFDHFVSEVTAHVSGARHYYPDCKAILDVGGQDSKAMLYNPEMNIWTSKMSGICAAGTGAFLDSVSAKLNVPITEMAQKCNFDSDLEVSSVCAVLGATSINKFKNRYPLGDVIAAACRAQARTIMSGVGELFLNYHGDIIFQGGVAYNRAVAYYLKEITGCNIIIPEFHPVMGALGAAVLARQYDSLRGKVTPPKTVETKRTGITIPEFKDFVDAVTDPSLRREAMNVFDKVVKKKSEDGSERLTFPELGNIKEALQSEKLKKTLDTFMDKVFNRTLVNKSTALRTKMTRHEFFSKGDAPLVWRNLFFPSEILAALGVRSLTLETYAALKGRNQKRLRRCFDHAACKGFSGETCSFLRVLEGDDDLPHADFTVTTSQPCQQGERIFADLVRSNCSSSSSRFYTLHTPGRGGESAVRTIASGLKEAVEAMEDALGLKMDPDRLAEACVLSNKARELAIKCNQIRFTSPPLIPGTEAVSYANIFSQLWGKPEMVELQQVFLEELLDRKKEVEKHTHIDETHRLLWLHLPPFYSARTMTYLEQTCHAPVAFEEVNFVGWEELDPNDPYTSLARKLLTVGFLDPEVRVNRIKQRANTAKITGAVLYNHMFGRCSMADSSFIKYLRQSLTEIGIPLLVLDGDCLDETTDPCSTLTKISAFTEALNLNKFGNIFGPIKK